MPCKWGIVNKLSCITRKAIVAIVSISHHINSRERFTRKYTVFRVTWPLISGPDTIPVPTLAIPDTDVAVHEYEQQGGSLTHNSLFENDPLRERCDLVTKRNQSFEVQIGSYEEIFTDVVSRNGDLLQRAILVFFCH